MTKKSVRLSEFIKPSRYRLILKPDLEAFTFSGEETIFLMITKPTNQLVLHAAEIEVLSAQYNFADKIYTPLDTIYSESDETITLKFSQKLPVSEGELKLAFKGILNDRMRGFYRSKYWHDGQEKYLATTQFEATDARRAFPCFDEPSHKAIFDVSLIVPQHLTAISNTVESVVKEHQPGLKIIEFASTPKMSTYLLAFIVGDLEYLEDKTEDGTIVRVFTTPGKKQQGQFALDVTMKALAFYNDYFDIKYPLPVLDLIAVPDFAAGAMENWGAVTYRESALLIDPDASSSINKQRVALVICHELAHMWFGDLVTMEWWTHLWLNEGFASYIEYLALDHIFPQWDMWTQFVNDDMGVALTLDALKSTHPVEVEVHHPSEIGEIFDKISYSKGASIIRMLADYLGDDIFRDGLRHYLKCHQYSNAKTEDLWQAFSEVSNLPIAEIMSGWTAQGGYPLITVNKSNHGFKVSQQRFLANPTKYKKDNSAWQIPLNYQTHLGRSTPVLMTATELDLPVNVDWLKINPGEYSFIRTKYSSQMLNLLKQVVVDQQFNAVDRLGLVRDIFDLSQSGDYSADQALDFGLAYRAETDYSVWSVISNGLYSVDNIIQTESYYPLFKKYVTDLYQPITKKVGWTPHDNDGHTTSLLRSLVLGMSGMFGDQLVIDQANQLFKQLQSGQAIDPNLRGLIYNLVAVKGDLQDYELLTQMHQQAENQQEKDRLARALAVFRDQSLLKRTLEYSQSEHVRVQDATFIMIAVISNPLGLKLGWQFIQDNWTDLQQKYGGNYLLPRLIESLGQSADLQLAKEIEQFFKANPSLEVGRTVAQVQEKIKANAAWLKRDSRKIQQFLEKLPLD